MVNQSLLFSSKRYQTGEQVIPVDEHVADAWIEAAILSTRASRAFNQYFLSGEISRDAIRNEINLPSEDWANVIFVVREDCGEKIRIALALSTTGKDVPKLFSIDVPRNSVTIA